jgi:hypothetical protein|tara:strand:+ start:20 stop:628 length:609 start_codon:yes stop_codon:yes gene_type:complete
MAIQLTFSNIMQLFSLIAPLLLGFFLVMLSLFNQSLKGFVYLGGVLIALVINIPIMNRIQSKIDPNSPIICNIIELPFLHRYNSPSPSTLFIGFTLAYLFLPMKYNNQINYILIAALLCLLALDCVTKVTNKCTSSGGALLGALLGFILGSIWYTLFHMAGYDSLLYFEELQSNNVICSRPAKQTFKCSVYKNGELISSNIA